MNKQTSFEIISPPSSLEPLLRNATGCGYLLLGSWQHSSVCCGAYCYLRPIVVLCDVIDVGGRAAVTDGFRVLGYRISADCAEVPDQGEFVDAIYEHVGVSKGASMSVERQRTL